MSRQHDDHELGRHKNSRLEELADKEEDNLTSVAAPAPINEGKDFEKQRRRESRLENAESNASRNDSLGEEEQDNLFEVAAPAPLNKRHDSSEQEDREGSLQKHEDEHHAPAPDHRSKSFKFLTQLYIFSYLIFFAIFGVLARLGVQWLTFYPGAPVTISNLWANFGGCVIMGFVTEDGQLFRQEWGTSSPKRKVKVDDEESSEEEAIKQAKGTHLKVKKTIPLYIGLTTGFCGSFTSFSTFVRDLFFALANTVPSPINHPYATPKAVTPNSTVPHNGGYSFEAVLAIIILTITVSSGGIMLGAHSAIGLERITPTLPFRFVRKFIDPLFVILGFGCWFGAIIMTVWPPDRPDGPDSMGIWRNEAWRGEALFQCVFAPLGCLLRFWLAASLNGLIYWFPLGTFAANMFGTALLGMCYDLQHVPLSKAPMAMIGGSRVGCQVLQGIEDGFCGALTTVSTWMVELHTLTRKHAYFYGLCSVAVGLALAVTIIGTVHWTIGFSQASCVVGKY